MPPEEETEEAREGTGTHELGELLMRNRPLPAVASNGVVVNQDMIAGATLYANHVLKVCAAEGITNLQIEQRVAMPQIHPHNWGTPDARGWSARGELHIWDFKFGHSFVDAYLNWQCMDYAIGALHEAAAADMLKPATVVHIYVVQPRNYDGAGPIRHWRVTVADLQQYAEQLRSAAHEAAGPNPRLIPGGHCKNCRALTMCPSANRAAMWSADMVKWHQPLDVTPAQAAARLAILQETLVLLNALTTAEEERVISMIRSGTQVPGMGLTSVKGREAWKGTDGEVTALGDVLGIPVTKPKPLTPGQVRALELPEALAPARDALLKQYAHRPSTFKLENVGDAARKFFG